MKFKRPRGTQDVIPPEIELWLAVERAFQETFEKHGYQPIRTPMFEMTELFQRAVGEGTDIISKEMYTFTDRGGRSLTLRPENTAAVIRAYLENGLHRTGGIVRFYYMGPMFRYDRPQAGRYRQFHQIGLEAIGQASSGLDVEVIEIVMRTLEALAFQGLHLKINSVGCKKCRGPYRDILVKELEKHRSELCGDCGERAFNNPLRVFDCKTCGDVKTKLPTILDHLCGDCQNWYESVKTALSETGRSFDEDPTLVRGLDYYTRTAFEILHGELGAQNALCGGGRYDDLIEECGGPPTPAIGFSAGLERIISVLPENSPAREAAVSPPDICLLCLDEAAVPRALTAAALLRAEWSVKADYSMRALKTQLKGAEKSRARAALIVDSRRADHLIWKDLAAREQTEVADGDVVAHARRALTLEKE